MAKEASRKYGQFFVALTSKVSTRETSKVRVPISASSAERSKAKMKSEKSVCPEVLPDNEV